MVDDSKSTVAAPPLRSLHDWHVIALADGLSEVRIVLADKDEARAWAVWMFDRCEDTTDAL